MGDLLYCPYGAAVMRALGLLFCLFCSLAAGACPPPLADFDGDGTVDTQDFARFRGFYESSAPQADFNCDDSVNSADFGIFMSRFGAAPRYSGLKPFQTGIVINLDDPASEALGLYYQSARSVPAENVVRVRLGNATSASIAQLGAARTLIPARLRAVALTFNRPTRIGNYNSVTSAFAYGYHQRPAGSNGADLGYANPYPAHAMRLAMMVPDRTVIDRGVAADRTAPAVPFICMVTTDRSRSQRCASLPASTSLTVVRANSANGPAIAYFQGLALVPGFPDFVPGGWADNLTSTGGIVGGGQTTVWDMLAVGATGSHGTVEEPYALPGKFPKPAIFRSRYLSGLTLIESAWGSVLFPYQGLFVGEPLANPWMREL